MTIKLNTGRGQATLTTSTVTGELDAIIVNADQPVEIIVESELGYPILHRSQVVGVYYFAPRARVTAPIWDMRDEVGWAKFNLEEALQITIVGPANVDVELTIRLCD